MRRDKAQDLMRTRDILLGKAPQLSSGGNSKNWLGHSGGAACIDALLLQGATMPELRECRGAVQSHFSHLDTEHGLPVVERQGRYVFAISDAQGHSRSKNPQPSQLLRKSQGSTDDFSSTRSGHNTAAGDDLLKRGSQIFLSPSPEYGYDEIILGTSVIGPGGKSHQMKAVASNSFITYRFYGEAEKVLSIYQQYFLENKQEILLRLSAVHSRDALDSLSEEIRLRNLKTCSSVSFKTNVDFAPFNRTRKIIDLYLEHLVAMSKELGGVRASLVPLLFLPLDSKMFSDPKIFEEAELATAGVNRRSTYGALTEKRGYDFLQQRLLHKANVLSANFYPIYFDLFWGAGRPKDRVARHQSWGNNLFETNLGQKQHKVSHD